VREEHNLPIVFDSFVSGKAKKAVASNMRSGLCHTRLNALDFFRDNDLGNLGQSPQNSVLDLEHFLNFCGACVGAAKNENISASQKELLKWHWKLGIEMYRSQEMMHERHYKDPDGRTTILPAIIQPKNASARNCIDPPHQSCFLACAKKCSPKVSRTQPLEDREGAITRDQYKVDGFVSTDQLICKMPGRLLTRYGRESQDCRFLGGTIYNDAASGLIWVENQVSLGANETVMGKARFEQWLWDQCVSEVKHYHGENGIFSAGNRRELVWDNLLGFQTNIHHW